MRINNKQSNINFNARYITSTQVKHIVENKYVNEKANFVELQKINNFDRLLLSDLSQDWNALLASRLYKNFKNNISTKYDKFFALTTQNKNFDIPDKNKILGIVEIMTFTKGIYFVDILQTNPKYIANQDKNLLTKLFDKINHALNKLTKNDKEYKNIGKSIIDIIKNKFRAITIELTPLDTAKEFYVKQGFKRINKKRPYIYTWHK